MRYNKQMLLDKEMRALIRKHEGVSQFPYVDTVGKITIGDQLNVAKNLFSIPESKFLSDIVVEKLAESFTEQFKDVNKNEAAELAKSAIEALIEPKAEVESFASKELELKQKQLMDEQ